MSRAQRQEAPPKMRPALTRAERSQLSLRRQKAATRLRRCSMFEHGAGKRVPAKKSFASLRMGASLCSKVGYFVDYSDDALRHDIEQHRQDIQGHTMKHEMEASTERDLVFAIQDEEALRALRNRYDALRILANRPKDVVLMARLRSSSGFVVARIVRNFWGDGPSDTRDRVVAEANRLCQLRHPHILRCSAAALIGSELWIEQSFCAGGTLRSHVAALHQKHLLAPECDVQRWVAHILAALTHLHARGIVHGDMRSSNGAASKQNSANELSFPDSRPPREARPLRPCPTSSRRR
jgi:serine/threonine protein kinase